MKPDIWGKYFWPTIHVTALEYPEEPEDNDKQSYQLFYYSMFDVLPCKKCRVHAKTHLKKYPIQLESRAELVKWTIDFHNAVNHTIGKRILSYKEAIREIQKAAEYKEKNNKFFYGVIIACLILAVIVYYVYKGRRMS